MSKVSIIKIFMCYIATFIYSIIIHVHVGHVLGKEIQCVVA